MAREIPEVDSDFVSVDLHWLHTIIHPDRGDIFTHKSILTVSLDQTGLPTPARSHGDDFDSLQRSDDLHSAVFLFSLLRLNSRSVVAGGIGAARHPACI